MESPIYFCGDGYSLVKGGIQLPNIMDTEEDKIDQSGVSVAKLAMKEYGEGRFVTDKELRPTYLRAPQAERERLERINKNKE